ncbi:hypothetical protein EG329_001461 [Mollisiaceae sp. DMI_Dod_QoI]|nr:hypothetical protein EG329_001461 [Helotiales sp. DMI_Dod_QoI]
MYTKDHSTMERSSSSASRSSFGTIKRSVPGMKNLLPLKLLPPTLPEFDIWPSLEATKRSTFGTRIGSQDCEQSSDIGDRARDSLISRKRSQQYRDTPIYSQPGSPIPSRAYFSEDDVGFNCSQPESISEEDSIISLKDYNTEADNHNYREVEQFACSPTGVSQDPCIIPPPRWSELSFQCSGEVLYEDESAWLRSPMSKNSSANDTILAVDVRDEDFAERTVESWLSDTSSSFEHEDEFLACATALSPSKAHVIDLRVNLNHPSNLSLRIPKRSSSLMGTSLPENNFWDTFGTPPITPAGPWDGDLKMFPKTPSLDHNINLQLPNRLDPTMPSPPLSPHGSPTVLASAMTGSSTKADALHLYPLDYDEQWPLPPSNSSPPLLADIIGSLEALTIGFPSSILLPDSPCISVIRSQNMYPCSPPAMDQCTTSSATLKSPFGHEFPRPPSYQPAGDPKTTNFPPHQKDFSSSTTNSLLPPYHHVQTMQPSSLPISAAPTCLYLPDLSSLQRIFPQTSDFMRSALYAHIVAHIFVTSLSPPMKKLQPSCLSGRRRDTPHWTSSPLSLKAASVLGIPHQDSDPTGDSAEKQLQFKVRIQALQQTLRKCIYYLISVMDSTLGIEDTTELDDSGPGFSNGKLFIRTLEEVVRNCEGSDNGIGVMF